MVEAGLVEECQCLYKQLKEDRDGKLILRERKGVAQSIGFKQLLPYLSCWDQRDPETGTGAEKEGEGDALGGAGVGRGGEKDSSLADKLKTAISDLKTDTKRYAQRQIKWIQGRIVPCCFGSDVDAPREDEKDAHNGLFELHEFDTSDVDLWEENVLKPAVALAKSFLKRKKKKPGSSLRGTNGGSDPQQAYAHGIVKSLQTWRKFECKDCGKQLNGEHEFKIHVKSRAHKKRKRNIRKTIEQKERAVAVRKARESARRQEQQRAELNPAEHAMSANAHDFLRE